MAAKKKREADPPRQIADLEGALRDSEPGRLYVLRGEERYFREAAIDLIRARSEAMGWEVSLHTGLKTHPDYNLSLLLGDLSGGSLFSSARLVVVRDCAPLLKKEGSKDSAFVRAAKAFLASADASGCLVIGADTIRADNALAKAAPGAGGAMLSCRKLWDSAPQWNPDPRQAELVLWLVRRSRELKQPLTPDQAMFVAAATGNDLFALEAQLEKIAVSGGKALQEIVGWSASVSPFQVADDLVSGNTARAVSGVEALYRGGFREKDGKRLVDFTGLSSILLGTILGQIRQAVAGSRAARVGADPVEGAARGGWNMAPNRRADFAARVRSRSPEMWAQMLEDVTRLEYSVRTGTALDANDFCSLALRWQLAKSSKAPTHAGRS
ncbi:MAG: DNA polymerase III delta subunit [Planctomycetota bacterium]|jgi:DNA polymerase III delta subunit